MARESFTLDPCEAPGSLSDVEKLLWDGRCPHCGEHSTFRWADSTTTLRVDPNDATKDVVLEGFVVCGYCGLEFEGLGQDADAQPDKRVLTSVKKMGRPDRRGGVPQKLPQRGR